MDETLKNMRIAIQRKELLGKRSFFLLESPMTQSSTYFTPGPDKKLLISMVYNMDFYEQMLIYLTWIKIQYGVHKNIYLSEISTNTQKVGHFLTGTILHTALNTAKAIQPHVLA